MTQLAGWDLFSIHEIRIHAVIVDWTVHSSEELRRRKIESLFLKVNFKRTIVYAVQIYQQQLWDGRNEWLNKLQIYITNTLYFPNSYPQYLYNQKL